MRVRQMAKRILGFAAMGLAALLCQSAHAASPPDFNGDGFADLAVGVPGEDLGTYTDTGVVHVIYGTAAGLNAANTRIFAAASCTWPPDGNASGNQNGLHFGEVLAWGDFNGDGCDDLAIGMPGYDAGGWADVGMVYVLPGSPAGLIFNQTKYFVSTNLGPPLNVNMDAGDRLGQALATGDFNGDGRDDLAIGVPGEEGWNGAKITDAGDVYVVYGSALGLRHTSAQGWSQNGKLIWPDIQDNPEAGDRFGSSLASGDFNGDGRDDLAIGVLAEDIGAIVDCGAVHIIYGGAAGLTNAGNQFIHGANVSGDGAEAGDRFGYALASGDFDGDGFDDMAVGAPSEDVMGIVDAGAVHAIYGNPFFGLGPAGSQFWHQNTAGIQDFCEAGDRFGTSLAAGHFNADIRSDLAIGVLGEDIGAVGDAGAVHILFGNAMALNAAGNQFWHQNVGGIQDFCEAGDGFGYHLVAADFNGDGRSDLSASAPRESVGAVAGAGAVNVLYSNGAGLNSIGNQFWHQNIAGIPEVCEPGDSWGWN
jgi:hypothetical protein